MAQIFQYNQLFHFVASVWQYYGFSLEHSEIAAENLILADLRGIDSHGVARLQGYINLIQAKRLNPNPQIHITHEALATATIDADAAVGLVSGHFAIEIAIQKAQKCGIGMTLVNHSNHFGIAYAHVKKALDKELVGIAFTNASAFVAPAGGKERMLGTNPMCYGFPVSNGRHFVADLATSAAANGKLEIAERLGKPIPEGWVMDEHGSSSTDSSILKKGGMMIPLGSFDSLGVHKGYALSSVVDIFSGVLSGANFGPWVPPFPAFAPLPKTQVGVGIGHAFWVIDPAAFRPKSEYDEAMLQWITRFKQSTPLHKDQPVLIPGEPEIAFETERMKYGIPLVDSVAQNLRNIAENCGLSSLLMQP
jgi:LDH2 family malate/lactate/ureidoglycolate dehydrogenase